MVHRAHSFWQAGLRASAATATRVRSGARQATQTARRLGWRATMLVILGWLWLAARWLLPALAAGALGSLAALITMGWLRLAWGSPTLPELLGERVLPLLNVNQFIQLLLAFAPNSKTGPLELALKYQGAVGVALGPIYALAARSSLRTRGWWPTRRGWLTAGVMALALEALTLLLFWPALYGNTMGYPVDEGRAINSLATLIVYVVFLLVIALLDHWLRLAWGPLLARLTFASPANNSPATSSKSRQRPAKPVPTANVAIASPLSRRQLFGAAGATVAVALGVWFGAQTLIQVITEYLRRSNLSYEGMETPYTVSQASQLTPNADFYVVSKNVLDPEVIIGDWQLEITGMVNNSRTWNYDEIRAMPDELRPITLECIANGPGGRLMSTAIWRGVSLEHVITAAGGATSGATYVIFYSVDGFSSSLPLADLLEARTMLAYEMNGERLPDHHGYPLRVVTPGRYGEQSPKWLTRIELADYHYKGLYQSQGWNDHQLYTTSRIESPAQLQQVNPGPQTVRGLAFAGIRKIEKVEVSPDDGATWSQAKLIPPLSDQTWVFWTWQWRPTTPGTYTLVVRATDGTGALQSPISTSTVPNGSTGLHRVQVVVR